MNLDLHLAWSNLHDFAAMGGYARYVWGSLGTVAAALGIEILTLRARGRAAVRAARKGVRA